jgi:hypothetical protein
MQQGQPQINNPDLGKITDMFNMLADGRVVSGKIAVATYDFSAQGGGIGAIDSGVSIPAGAIIRKVWIDSLVTATSAGDTGTMAVSVVAANDIVTAIAINDASNPWDLGLHDGKPAGTAATMIKLAAAATIKFTIAVQAFTAGKFNVFVEYVISN